MTKLGKIATALTLLQRQPRTISAFIPRITTITRLPSSTTNNMSTSESMTQPDVSSFMNSERPAETKDYIMQQTMIRVKDPVKSLDFYCNILGFKLIHYSEVSAYSFSCCIHTPLNHSFTFLSILSYSPLVSSSFLNGISTYTLWRPSILQNLHGMKGGIIA